MSHFKYFSNILANDTIESLLLYCQTGINEIWQSRLLALGDFKNKKLPELRSYELLEVRRVCLLRIDTQ
jgi:hypothetical protein